MTPPPAATGWVAEATFQFRLAVAWERLAVAVHPLNAELATSLRERVLGRVFLAPWFPGLARDWVAKVEKAAEYPVGWWYAVAGKFVADWPAGGANEGDTAELWKRAFRTTDKAVAMPHDPPGPWPQWVNLLSWVNLAAALDGWADLAPQIGRVADDESVDLLTLSNALRQQKGEALLQDFLARLGRYFERTTAAQQVSVRRAIDGVRTALHELSADWPPRLIQRAVAALRDVGSDLDRPIVGPVNDLNNHPLAARLGLISALAGEIAQSEKARGWPLSEGTWRVFGAAAEALVAPFEALVQIGREPASPAEVEHNKASTFTRCEHPRIELRRADGTPLHTLPGLFVGPPPVPPLVADLDAAAVAAERAGDPEFADLCREVVGLWPDGSPPATRPPDTHLALLWRLTVRATLRQDDVGGLVLNALSKVGIRPDVFPATADAQPPAGGWVVVADPSPTAAHGTSVTAQLGVRFRDQEVFAPAVCLRVRSTGRKWIDLLSNVAPLVVELRHRDRDWPGWKGYDERVWRVAYAPPASAEQEDADALDHAFEAVYTRREEVSDELKSGYTALARQLYLCGRELRHAYPLDLDPDTLLPRPLPKGPPDARSPRVKWAAGDLPRAVIEILQFPRDGQPADLRVSIGKALRPLLGWLELSDPPNGPLADWVGFAAELPWHTDEWPTQEVVEVKAQTADWLRKGGADWFDREVRAGNPWVTQLLAEKWCECYPRREGAAAVWEGDPLAIGVSWEFSDHPPGHAIRDVRYATTPDLAAGVFSLGPRPNTPTALSLATDLVPAADSLPEAKAVYDAEVRRHFKKPADVEGAVLGLAGRWAELSAAAQQIARGWAGQHQGRFLTDAPPDADVRFDDTVGRDETRVLKCGVELNGRVLRPVQAFRSAGRLPHYATLRREVEAHAKELLDDLDRWPRQAVEGGLRDAAVEFYKRFWDKCGKHPAPPPLSAAADALNRVLVESFEITEFAPTQTNEYPDNWLRLPPNAQATFGNVRALGRPGLSEKKRLVLPAIVTKVE